MVLTAAAAAVTLATTADPPREPDPPAPAATPSDDASAAPRGPTSAADRPEAATLVMWGHGGLSDETVARAEELPGVIAATLVRSDTLGLTGSRRADGTVVDRIPVGYQVPVDVAAIDPRDGLALGDAAWLASLRPGHVLLTETSAGLRRLAVGDRLDLGQHHDLEVAAIIPDGQVGRAEIVVHPADADPAGLEPDGTLWVRHDARDGPAREQLEDALRALAPGDARVRVVGGERPRRAPLVLSLAEVKRRFGEPVYRPRPGVREVDLLDAFVEEHIVSADVAILGRVRCHREIIDDLRGALEEIVASGLADTIDPSRYAGCHHARRIGTSSTSLSRHTWGIALDINVDLSLPGLGPPPDPRVIAAFERHGFRWGGDFLVPDNHHFEWVGPAATGRR